MGSNALLYVLAQIFAVYPRLYAVIVAYIVACLAYYKDSLVSIALEHIHAFGWSKNIIVIFIISSGRNVESEGRNTFYVKN